jgi:hypothetical protein
MKKEDKAEQPELETSRRKKGSSPPDPTDWTWADPKNLKVDSEFQRLIPLQSKGELLALEESIEKEGCRDPLLIWKGRNILLDGHTRRELCIKHDKQVKVREIELSDEKAAVEYILQIQRQRRNLTREAMSYFRGAEYNAIKQQRGGHKPGRKPKGQSDPLLTTAKFLGDKYGVSEKTVKRDAVFAHAIDKIVTEYGDPEIRRKLLGADIKLTQGLARLLLKKSGPDQKAAVNQLLDQGEMSRSDDKPRKKTPKPRDVAQSLIERLKKKGEAHPKAVVLQMARILGLELVEGASDT